MKVKPLTAIALFVATLKLQNTCIALFIYICVKSYAIQRLSNL